MNNSDHVHSRGSTFLHRIDTLVAHTITAVFVSILTIAFLVIGAVIGFPRSWIDILEIVGTSITLVMVFVIRHTQTRQETAIQLKLDEVIRSLPQAHNELIGVENARPDELVDRGEQNADLRQQAVEKSAAAENK